MGTLLVLAWVSMFAGFLWLVVRAFSTSTGWGFAVFFLSPISAMIYAAKYWEEAKKPFLVYMGSVGAATIILTSMVTSWVDQELTDVSTQMENGTQQVKLTEEEKLAIKLTEKTVDLTEKFATSEKDHQSIAVMRHFIEYQKSGKAEAKRTELRHSILELLKRPDLDDTQRQSLKEMLQELEEDGKTLIVKNSATDPQHNKVDSPKVKVAPLENQQERSRDRQPVTAKSRTSGADQAVKPAQTQRNATALGIHPTEDHFNSDASPGPKEDDSPFRIISPAQAKDYIGFQVDLVSHTGSNQTAYLIGVSGDSVEFEQRLSVGTFAFSYRQSEIKSLKIYQ